MTVSYKNLFLSCRKFILGTGVALAVISSSGKVSPSFEDHLISTVVGEFSTELLL